MIEMETEIKDEVRHVQQKVRQRSEAYRAKKRSDLRASHRFNLEKVANDVKIPDLDEIYKLTIALKRKKQLYTLHKLRMGLSVGGDSIKVFLSIENALYAVVGCLTGTCAEMKSEALNVLINLGLGTPEQCEVVFKAVSIYFTYNFNSNFSDIQDASAWCIGNLCLNSMIICQQMDKSGLTTQLFKLLKSPVSRVFQSSAYALAHYCSTIEESRKRDIFFDQEGIEAVEIVQDIIEGLDKFSEATAEAGFLMVVISSNQSVCELMLSQNIIPVALNSLEKFIHKQNFEVSSATSLLRVLINCVASTPQSVTQVCNRSEQFVTICKSLLYSPHHHLRNETLQLVANVINGASKSPCGQLLIIEQKLQPRLDSAVRSALAANFNLNLPKSDIYNSVL